MLTAFGISLVSMSGCPEPGDEAGGEGDGTGETGFASEGGAEGDEDVRPPLDAGGEGETGDGDGDGDGGLTGEGGSTGDGDGDLMGDGDGDGVFDPVDRCWDRSWGVTEFPAVLFDNTIGRNDDVLGDCGIDPSPDVQVGFVAPVAGVFVFDSTGSAFDTVVSVAAGQCGGELTCNDDFIDLSSRVVVELDEGEEVTVSVDGTNSFEEGPVKLSVDLFEPPQCEAEMLNPPLPKQVAGDTSANQNELGSACGGSTAPEQIYRFVAPGPGTYHFSTKGSSFDTVLYALEDCAEAPIACNDDAGFELHSELTVELAGGAQTLIVVDGHGEDELGEFVLAVEKL